MKQPNEPPLSWSNFSLRQDCYIGWNPPQGRSAAAGGQNPIFPGNPRKTWSLDRPRGGREQGIVRDEHGQDQPTGKERAQHEIQGRPRRRSPDKAVAVGQHGLTSDAFIARGAGVSRYTLERRDMASQTPLFLSSPPSKKVVVSLGRILLRNVFTAVFLDEEATEFFGRCSGRALLCGPRLGFVEPVLCRLETF